MLPTGGWIAQRKNHDAYPPVRQLPVPETIAYSDVLESRIGPRLVGADVFEEVNILLERVKREGFTVTISIESLNAIVLVDRIE